MLSKLTTIVLLVALSTLCTAAVAEPLEVNSKQQLQQMLEQHKGKVIYLDFWASWCVPCRKSFPWMNAMQEKYSTQGFKVITVNVDVERFLAEEFLAETPANFSIIYDPKGQVAKQFKLQGMPSSYLIDRAGKPTSTHVGFFNDKKAEYEAEIVNLLQK